MAIKKRVSFNFAGQAIEATLLKEHIRNSFIAFTDLSDGTFKIIAKEDYDYEQYLKLFKELNRQVDS